MDLQKYIKTRGAQVDRALGRLLPKEGVRPPTIHKAMRYSMFAGGKRLRPILCLAAAEACEGSVASAMPLACSVECIHTYSLIHDDLPCMDDDDFRRGRPTSHKVFGEGVAVLAGDALLTVAFEMVAKSQVGRRYSHADLVRELALAAGSLNLIAGQVADLEGEGRNLGLADLRFIHQRKTAALIRTSLRLGGMSANAPSGKLRALSDFGLALGLAFQIIDDILDVTHTSEHLGKSAGKDVRAGKSTYPALLGLPGAQREADRWTRRALGALEVFGKRGMMLRAIAGHLLKRTN
ncbi:MAG: polyprenyl synthetase family protein [Verrucomicrobiae bacterium]|nr:polyprenyl synthetase family protein [Verrucomicrobiae bacterium]